MRGGVSSFFLLFLCLFPLASVRAEVCEGSSLSLDDRVDVAEKIFIGKVVDIQDGKVSFHVQSPLRATVLDETMVLDHATHPCGYIFKIGETWLYMGTEKTHFSLMVYDEFLRLGARSIPLILPKLNEKNFPVPPTKNATLVNACTPWDGGAFRVEMQNGMSATVYKPFPMLDEKALTPERFPTADRARFKHALLRRCDTETGQICNALQGTVAVIRHLDNTANGHFSWVEEGKTFVEPFFADYNPQPANCRMRP